jgi:hypothetical protein
MSLGVVFAMAASSAVIYGCSSNSSRSGFDGEGTPSGGASSSSGGGILGSGSEDGGPGGGQGCVPNPANYDIPGNNCDDDGDGTIDNPPTCDGSLSETGSAEDFAKAMGICQTVAKDGYGLVSAEYLDGYNVTTAAPDGQHGILSKFGSVLKPREGKQLGVLSSGYAQEYDGAAGASFMKDSKWWSPDNPGTVPSGFPKPASGCKVSTEVHDVINVKLTLKAPQNASGVKFDFNFFSSEWPAFICSKFNDSFIAYLTAKGFNGGNADNMSFDSNKNPVSVNNGFFDRCTPGVTTGCAPGAKAGTSVCPGGPGELAGTGYGIEDQYCLGASGMDTSTGGGATGWLTSQAPVQAGEQFTIEFMIWDTGDSDLDSSVLLDNFTWVAGAVTTTTDRPPR